MTFADAVLRREDFDFTVMGMPLSIEFNKTLCEAKAVCGTVHVGVSRIFLDPGMHDNLLLDTACHEIMEYVDARMEWRLEHRQINALGVLFGSLLECSI